MNYTVPLNRATDNSTGTLAFTEPVLTADNNACRYASLTCDVRVYVNSMALTTADSAHDMNVDSASRPHLYTSSLLSDSTEFRCSNTGPRGSSDLWSNSEPFNVNGIATSAANSQVLSL